MDSLTTSDPVATQATVAAVEESKPDRPESASPALTGRMVLAAWALSIFVHLILFVSMLVAVFPFSEEAEAPPTSVVETRIVGSMERAPIAAPQREVGTRAKMPEVQAPRMVPDEVTPLAELTQAKKPEMSIIGVGAGGGDFMNLGLSAGRVPPTEFFGVGGSTRGAKRIVYVVDRSGSMTDTFAFVQKEMKRSVAALRRSQKFHVIFFSSGVPLENPPRELVSAINAYKEAFYSFLDGVRPEGGTEPLAALRRAFSLDPDVIYLLSDGHDFPPSLRARLDEWDADRRVAIHTIAYLDPEGRTVLERVAREHKGEFRYVSEDDLP